MSFQDPSSQFDPAVIMIMSCPVVALLMLLYFVCIKPALVLPDIDKVPELADCIARRVKIDGRTSTVVRCPRSITTTREGNVEVVVDDR